MSRMLCIWFPHWPLQRVVSKQPQLREQPLVLYRAPGQPPATQPPATQPPATQPPTTQAQIQAKAGVRPGGRPSGAIVVACSAAARQLGVRPQMPLVEAQTFLPRGGARLLAHDPQADLEALRQLAVWAQQHSPLVGLETLSEQPRPVRRRQKLPRTASSSPKTASRERLGPDCLYLDVTQLGPLYGGERRLAECVGEQLRARGYVPRIAVADTLGAAWAAAHFLAGSQPHSLSVLEPQAQRTALGPLSVTALRLEPPVAGLLKRLGIETIAQLLPLPRASVAERLGDSVLRRLDETLGDRREIIVAYHPATEFRVEHSLEYPLASQTLLQQLLRRLLDRLLDQLAVVHRGIIQLDCRLKCTSGPPLGTSLVLYQPTLTAEHLWSLLALKISSAPLKQPVQHVALTASSTASLASRQGQLFAATRHGTSRQLALLIDRLSSRLGADCVLKPQLLADAQPERSYRLRPWTAPRTRAAASPTAASPTAASPTTASPADHRNPEGAGTAEHPAPLQRPLRLYDPPRPLSECGDLFPWSSSLQGLASALHQRNTAALAELGVLGCWGPERIETGWWRGRLVRRDYYRLQTRAHQRLWVYQELNSGTWYLQGLF